MRPVLLFMLVVVAGCQCGAPTGFELAAENPLDFGTLAMGTRKVLTVELRNRGTTSVALTSVEGTTAVFLVERSSLTLEPNRAVNLNVIFAPPIDVDPSLTRRAHRADLVFRVSNGAEVVLPVKGLAVRETCAAPQPLDFGAVMVGDAARRRVDGAGITLGGVTGDGFSAVNGPDGLDVSFAPARPGEFIGEATYRPGPNCPDDVKVSLRGTAVDEALECQPSPLDFGFVTPGLSRTSTLRLRNRTSAPVMLSDVKAAIGASTSNEYQVIGATAVTVPVATRPGGLWVPGEVELTVKFTPSLLGVRNAALTATTSVPVQPLVSCALRGTGGGPDIDVRPTTLDFGRVPVFAGSGVTRKVSIVNVGTLDPTGAANLHVSRWDVTPKNAASRFSDLCVGTSDAANGCVGAFPAGYDLAMGLAARGGAQLDVPIRVMPSAADADLEWDVTFYSDDPDEPAVTVNVRARGVSLPVCSYTVTPAALGFGLLGSSPRTLTLTLTNTGAEQCLITWLDLDPGSAPAFSLPNGPLDNRELLPGQSLLVPVKATPPPGPSAVVQTLVGGLTINANAPTKQLPLYAQAGPGCLLISPAGHDFGAVKRDCGSEPRAFTVYNTCAFGVAVQAFGISATGAPAGSASCPATVPCPELRLVGTPSLTVASVLPPSVAAPATFTLEYRPLDLGADFGTVLLRVDEAGVLVDYVVPLSGSGDATGERTDTFRQDSKPKVDLLYVIDSSPSMADEQQSLAQSSGISAFLRYANAAGVDFHIGVTVADLSRPSAMVGALVGAPAVLTPQTPGAEALLAQRLKVGTSPGTVRGVAEPAVRAVSDPLLLSGVNRGFLREDAVLSIVGITDGRDLSPGTAAFYEARLLDVKGRRGAVSYNVVGPSWPARMGCNTDDPWPNMSKLRALTLAFDGGHSEICDLMMSSWVTLLENLGKKAFGFRTTFALSAAPEVSSGVVVKLDHGQGGGGVVVAPVDPQGRPVWRFDSVANAVEFEPLFVPAPGDVLTVTYTPACH